MKTGVAVYIRASQIDNTMIKQLITVIVGDYHKATRRAIEIVSEIEKDLEDKGLAAGNCYDTDVSNGTRVYNNNKYNISHFYMTTTAEGRRGGAYVDHGHPPIPIEEV